MRLAPLHPSCIVARLNGPAEIRAYLAARAPRQAARRRRRQVQQIPMPWEPMCCAELARIMRWSWARMARRMAAVGLALPGGSVLGVRASLDQMGMRA